MIRGSVKQELSAFIIQPGNTQLCVHRKLWAVFSNPWEPEEVLMTVSVHCPKYEWEWENFDFSHNSDNSSMIMVDLLDSTCPVAQTQAGDHSKYSHSTAQVAQSVVMHNLTQTSLPATFYMFCQHFCATAS